MECSHTYIPYKTAKLASAIRKGTGDEQTWISNQSTNETLIDLTSTLVEYVSDPTVRRSRTMLPPSGDRKLEAGTNGCQVYRVVLSCKSSSQSYPEDQPHHLFRCEHATRQPYIINARVIYPAQSSMPHSGNFLQRNYSNFVRHFCLLPFRLETRENHKPAKR
jgi:hypothetical protein